MIAHRLVAAAVLALPAVVAAAGADTASVTALDTIQVTANRVAESAQSAPQAVSRVSAEDLARVSARIATDYLRGQPGVYLQSSGPGQGVVIVRGLKGSELLHLVDGMRLNMTFFRNSPNQYIGLVDPYNLEGVEVLRGSGSTLYGSDAMGGVVQFLTPEQRFSGADWDARGGTHLQFGSADLSRVARAWAAIGHETLSLAAGVTYADVESYQTGSGGRLPGDQVAHRVRGYDLKTLWAPVPGHELMLNLQAFEYPRLPRYFEISAQPNSDPPGLPQRSEALFEPNDRQFLHARYRYDASTPLSDTLALHWARQIINDDRSVIPQRPDQPAGRRELERNRSTLDGLTLQLGKTLTDTLHLTYGLDLYRDAVASRKRCEPLAGSCPATAEIPVFADGSEQDSAGVYGALQWRLSEDWRLDGGLRYSRIATDLTATPLSPAAKIDDEDLTGHLSSGYVVQPGLMWTANLSRGFRAPNLFDLGTLGPRGGSAQINVPNPALTPETVLSTDTGLRWNRDGIAVELVAFYSTYSDRIESREPTGNTIPNGRFGCATEGGCPEVQSRNISKAIYWGLESGLDWAISDGTSLHAVVNLTRGTEQRAGAAKTPANRVPPINGRLGLRHALGATFELEPYLLWADAQRRLDGDDQGDIRIAPGGTAGWGTLNLRLSWSPGARYRLQLEGINLLDKAYREHGSGIDGAGAGAVLSMTARLE